MPPGEKGEKGDGLDQNDQGHDSQHKATVSIRETVEEINSHNHTYHGRAAIVDARRRISREPCRTASGEIGPRTHQRCRIGPRQSLPCTACRSAIRGNRSQGRSPWPPVAEPSTCHRWHEPRLPRRSDSLPRSPAGITVSRLDPPTRPSRSRNASG